MVFNSVSFLIFFPIVVLSYYGMPKALKNVWLLLASYYFYSCWNVKYCFLLLVCTLVSYFAGLLLDFARTETLLRKRICLISLLFLTGILAVYKYSDFAIQNLNVILRILKSTQEIKPLQLMLPVGISFFTFQALGYLIDVYRGTIPAERSFVNLALFLSFFPQLLSGPIGRADQLLPQYKEIKPFDYQNIQSGFGRFVWGGI